MAAGKYSFILEQGTTTSFEIQYKDASSNPIDLTGYTGRMQIRSDYADNTPTTYADITTTPNVDGSGLDFTGLGGGYPTTSGSIGIYISADLTSTFTFDTAKYDLELYKDSTVIRLLEGQIKLSKEVTRS